MKHSPAVSRGLREVSRYPVPTVADLERADRALARILRAVAESADRYEHLDVEEREGEHGALSNDIIREAVRARRALGMEDAGYVEKVRDEA